MKIIQEKNYAVLSRRAAEIILAAVREKPDCVLGLATGSTPIGAYDCLAEAYREGRATFRHVRTVNLDEYAGLGADDPQSYRYFMEKHLFSRIDVQRENTHIPNGLAESPAMECRRYDALCEALGGIDLQLLGIGENGHIGFNEPAQALDVHTHTVTLAESTRLANSRNFKSLDDVPRSALTLGMGGIMRAKRILLLASGEQKREALQKAVSGKVDPEVPASFLQLHPDVTVICDFDLNCAEL